MSLVPLPADGKLAEEVEEAEEVEMDENARRSGRTVRRCAKPTYPYVSTKKVGGEAMKSSDVDGSFS